MKKSNAGLLPISGEKKSGHSLMWLPTAFGHLLTNIPASGWGIMAWEGRWA